MLSVCVCVCVSESVSVSVFVYVCVCLCVHDCVIVEKRPACIVLATEARTSAIDIELYRLVDSRTF